MSSSLEQRSGFKCELCSSADGLQRYEVEPSDGSDEQSVLLCSQCKSQIENNEFDSTHFNCLNDSMWSEIPAVVVLSYRILNALGRQDLVDMIYMEDSIKAWADASPLWSSTNDDLAYRDSNGVALEAGDSVSIIKDLDVKGTSFVAKRGTTVKNISLVADDPTHIEGRVNGVKIHILTKYLKKI